jgi:acetyl-CoA carboxylase biotin carboxyl carrier protein
MKVQEIQGLLDFIAKSDLAEVTIETDTLKVSVKRYAGAVQQTNVIPVTPVVTQPQVMAQPAITQTTPVAETKTATADTSKANLIAIRSPMVGTFYASSKPDAPVFVNVGDDVKVGKVVGIVEAMKLFNEIESEVSGKIVEIVAKNATPVEYDQVLFWVQPS